MGGAGTEVLATIGDLRLRNDRRLAIAGQALLLIPSLWFIQTDLQLFLGDWQRLKERLIVRAGLVGLPLVGIWLLRNMQTRQRYSNAVLAISMVLSVFTIAINLQRPAGSGLPLRGPIMVLCVQYFTMPDHLLRQCVGPWLLSVAVIVLRLFVLNGHPPDVAGDVVSILVFNAVGAMTIWRRGQLDAVSDSAVRQLKALRDIIPICSHCRKLRTEVGDWQQLEQYFRQHSDTLFSHGICPECLKTVYKDELFEVPK